MFSSQYPHSSRVSYCVNCDHSLTFRSSRHTRRRHPLLHQHPQRQGRTLDHLYVLASLCILSIPLRSVPHDLALNALLMPSTLQNHRRQRPSPPHIRIIGLNTSLATSPFHASSRVHWYHHIISCNAPSLISIPQRFRDRESSCATVALLLLACGERCLHTVCRELADTRAWGIQFNKIQKIDCRWIPISYN